MKKIEQNLRQHVIISEQSLSDYLSLVSRPYQGDEYSELHHICPKSMFPTLAKTEWNIVRLKYDDHIEAHRLLCEMYMNGQMKRAYSFISRHSMTEKIKHLTSGAFAGTNNPACKPGVGKKISMSKTGKPRPDMVGTRYFGADPDVAQAGIDKMSDKLKGTVIVKDSKGDKFRVSLDDARYKNGELVAFNSGVTRENSASKRPEVMNQIMCTRAANYEKFSTFSFDDMVQFLIDAHNSGKNIFGKTKPFAKNYSGYCKRTQYDQNELKESVVQRLSKG